MKIKLLEKTLVKNKKVNLVIGVETEKVAANMQPGDILRLESSRFHPGETKNDLTLARKLAKLADLMVK